MWFRTKFALLCFGLVPEFPFLPWQRLHFHFGHKMAADKHPSKPLKAETLMFPVNKFGGKSNKISLKAD